MFERVYLCELKKAFICFGEGRRYVGYVGVSGIFLKFLVLFREVNLLVLFECVLIVKMRGKWELFVFG